MSSLYMGTAASGRKYNSITDCFTVLQNEDVILVDPMANNAYYDAIGNFPSDKSVFIKADIDKNYDHLNLMSNTAYKVRFYLSGNSNPFRMNNSGTSKTTNIVFESLHLDLNSYALAFGTTPYGNILFNKCRLTVARGRYAFVSLMIRGLIEFRNCHIDFNGSTFFFSDMDFGAVINFIKCTTNNLSYFNGPGVNNNSRLFKPQIKDIVDVNSNISDYGVNWGKEIIATNRPIIAGRLLDNGSPVIKPVYLFNKLYQRKVASTVSDATGYFEFDVRNYLTDSLVLVTLKNPANSNEYIILNDVKAVDPRA